MKLLVLIIAVIAFAPAFASCGRSERATNTNARGRSADRIAPNPESRPCVNLNTAPAEELTRLPGIGEVIAKRVIDYRERNGRFRRPEEIIIIQGISEKKYRSIAGMVCVE
jgi:competence protein ComEA